MPRGLIWAGVAIACVLPLILAANSPLLAWRQPIYIAAGLAGIAAMGLLPLHMFLGLGDRALRSWHRILGVVLLGLILIHIAGLWITSPPDMSDALLFRAPTAFSVFGVVAMWALLATAVLSLQRRKLRFAVWRRLHLALGSVIATGTVAHAVLIVGTMESLSKYALSGVVLTGLAAVWMRVRRAQKGRG